ncbi:twin-arginine translocase TatA/TatE family subunit [Parerythrobacter jejuensis]|uniref:Sec-independent protein translocase protein TatA n=1 Tax=Parerythrobacter jejuensis TaxID=795812 RepID=A0A845ARQ8_9SPHN|nr:twin-arginine translocase TatA/TatE family subunit [Parerythrobacter jejuensis]MXP31605.1 twin-arginine translocase TatA/TatE family subunit [Parerythrobacter jejuensis]
MGGIGIWQILIVAVVILVLFGRGRISEMMGDFGKGVSSFKKGLNEEESPSEPAAKIEGPAQDVAPSKDAATDNQPADKQG